MTDRLALDLPDGRVLDLQVSGPDDGVPFIWHHGTPGFSFQPRKRQEVLHRRGLRFVSYTRAGAAGSTRHLGRSVADVAADVAVIADHLGAERFLTGGGSGGGPHALATAAGLPDRVLAVLAVCCPTPYVGREGDWLEGMGEDNVEEFTLALQGEEALRPFLAEQRDGMLGADAEGMIRTLDSLLPAVDRAVLTSELGEDLIRGLQGGAEVIDGWVDDDLAFAGHWGFDLDDLRVPTYLWQGTADLMVPFRHGEWLAEHIPGVVPHLEEGEGHFSIVFGAFDRMVDELLPHVPGRSG